MAALFEFLLRMGDNSLILGQRVSEWCGNAPAIEEDIALSNIALDLIGQTQLWLGLAGEVEGQGRTADDLAFLRDAWDFRNVLLVEQPNGDYGHTMMRQYLFDEAHLLRLRGLTQSSDPRIAEIAAKAEKEVSYHLERSRMTVIGLGDGTVESRARMQAALEALWPFTPELFAADAGDAELAASGVAPDPSAMLAPYEAAVAATMAEATLRLPERVFTIQGGRDGSMHSEHFGHILSSMQWLQRAYPGATW
jgi:ring-1,2-phenylacetyl-CoA epoxidase subunit PaaC